MAASQGQGLPSSSQPSLCSLNFRSDLHLVQALISTCSLLDIGDNWPKFVITRSDPIQYRNGIVHENVTELIEEGRTFGVEQRNALSRTDD